MRPDDMSLEEQLVASAAVAEYRRTQMADKIQFQTNVPETIALKYANGKRVESRYNDYEVYYTLADGRAMYATPALDAKIAELQLSPNEPFTICKREVKDGNKKRVEWQVARASQPEQQVSRPAAPEQTTRQSPNGSSSPQHIAPAATMTQLMGGALIAAIDSLVAAQEYGARKGLKLEFNEEDVRAAANSIFIQYFKDVELRARYGYGVAAEPKAAQRVNGGVQ